MIKTIEKPLEKLPKEIIYIFKKLFHNKNLDIYIHGSWADNTNVFFSDIDDFVIINDDNDDVYKKTCQLLKKSEIRFARVDPLQHHGHWTVKKSEIQSYDDAFLPHYTLNNATCINGNPLINFKLDNEIADNKIRQYLLFTLFNIHSKNNKIRNEKLSAFELKALASSYSLLPPLIYQTLGQKLDKKTAIQQFIREHGNVDAFRWASDVRSNFEFLKKSFSYKLFSKLPYFFSNYDRWYTFSLKHSPKVNINSFNSEVIYNDSISKDFAYLCHELIRDKIIIKYSHEDCTNIIDDFIGLIKSEEDVICVYKFGEIKDPGISDVDLLIVVKDGHLKNLYSIINKLIRSNIHFSYLFLHDPIIVEEGDLAAFKKIHSLENISCIVSKKEIVFEQTEQDIKQAIYLNWILFLLQYTDEVINGIVGYDERQIHHLLKNVSVSLNYIDPDSKVKDKIVQIRRKSINGQIGKKELDNELKVLYKKLINANFDVFNNNIHKCVRKKFLAGKNVIFIKSDSVKFVTKNNKVIYYLPSPLFDYSYDLIINTKSNNVIKDSWLKLEMKYRNNDVPLMTVFPFHHSWLRQKNPNFKLKIKYWIFNILELIPNCLFWKY
ncbi:MAG: hypothetical protein N4A74_11535 [Carboxylicivirga sp.]|jgi:predicted nucleotidyltransferase|nr:hypothetical protein [Carboxylicivirga sp.]